MWISGLPEFIGISLLCNLPGLETLVNYVTYKLSFLNSVWNYDLCIRIFFLSRLICELDVILDLALRILCIFSNMFIFFFTLVMYFLAQNLEVQQWRILFGKGL